jgi:predicted permease
VLKDSLSSTSGASRSLLGRGLVVLQVALSLLLLVGAGLFIRTLLNLQRIEPGFNTRNLLLFGVEPALAGYNGERLRQFYQRMSERLEALPGVQAVTFSRVRLLAGGTSSRETFLQAGPDGGTTRIGSVNLHQVRENFFEVMEIPLLAGRTIKPQDDERAPRVAVVNQAFARRHFSNENPVGGRFGFSDRRANEIEIVGMVRDAKYARQHDEIQPTAYLPWRQDLRSLARANFEVRIAGDPAAIVGAIRQAVREVDATLPLIDIRTQADQADQMLAMERLLARLLTLFGLLALQLASIGLFGILAYAVSQRTREIGIRMALGADRGDVLRMILRQGMALVLLGIGLGLAGSYVLMQYLGSWVNLSGMLYGVQPSDPLSYGVIAVLLMLVGLVSCFIPAWRATKVDPMTALKCEQ